jgi:hypothetical protein
MNSWNGIPGITPVTWRARRGCGRARSASCKLKRAREQFLVPMRPPTRTRARYCRPPQAGASRWPRQLRRGSDSSFLEVAWPASRPLPW